MTPEQERDVSDALLAYWTSRDAAAAEQLARGAKDVGERRGVTSGGHLDRLAQLLGRICIAAGAPADQVYYKAPQGDPHRRESAAMGYTLPGFFRPTKQWDVVVYANDMPIVVLELKSQKGPSYSNNANNRAEEAIGSAVDFMWARDAGLIPGDAWLGYAYVIEEDDQSRRLRGQRDRGQYPKDAAFQNWSYVDRVRVLAQRLVAAGFYASAWAMATSRPPCFGWRELDPQTSGYTQFVEGLAAAIGRYYPNPSGAGQISLFR
jgi:hypothetical protein